MRYSAIGFKAEGRRQKAEGSCKSVFVRTRQMAQPLPFSWHQTPSPFAPWAKGEGATPEAKALASPFGRRAMREEGGNDSEDKSVNRINKDKSGNTHSTSLLLSVRTCSKSNDMQATAKTRAMFMVAYSTPMQR